VDFVRKIAIFLAVLMVMSASFGYCIPATLDTAIEGRKNSDLHPVADAGEMLGMVGQGVDATMDAVHSVTAPLSPVTDPIYRVKDEAVGMTKKVINTTWDMLTLRSKRK
jgi:hypothetical protein